MPKYNFKKTIYKWRVRAGFIGIILAVILAKPNSAFLLGGIGVCSLGLLLRTWASGHLRKQKELAISGPYQYTRNPLYLGNLIIGISIVIASRSWWVLGIVITYFLFFYPLVIREEKERMQRLFPKEYETYKKKTPLLFPSWKPLSPSNKNSFSWQLYRKNKEWKAFLGAILFWLILICKAAFL